MKYWGKKKERFENEIDLIIEGNHKETIDEIEYLCQIPDFLEIIKSQIELARISFAKQISLLKPKEEKNAIGTHTDNVISIWGRNPEDEKILASLKENPDLWEYIKALAKYPKYAKKRSEEHNNIVVAFKLNIGDG